MKVTRYSYLLTFNDRKWHEHLTEHGAVKRFVVQYETFIDGNWCPIIRYDTAHGFPHMDRIHPDGTVEKIPLTHQGAGRGVDIR